MIAAVPRPRFVSPLGRHMEAFIDLMRPFGIIESNSYVLSGLVTEDGGIPLRRPIVKDDREKIKKALLSVHDEADLILAMREEKKSNPNDWIGQMFVSWNFLPACLAPGNPTMAGRGTAFPVLA